VKGCHGCGQADEQQVEAAINPSTPSRSMILSAACKITDRHRGERFPSACRAPHCMLTLFVNNVDNVAG
jgi:hypothetical protein